MAFYVYALVLVLSAFGLTIPEKALYPFEMIGGANTLLCFMIIGICLSFNITWEQLKHVMQAWFTPMTSIAPIMTMRAIPEQAEESADLNTIAIVSSLVFVTIMNSITSPLA